MFACSVNRDRKAGTSGFGERIHLHIQTAAAMLRGNSTEEQLQLHCRSVQLVMTGSNNSALQSTVQQSARS